MNVTAVLSGSFVSDLGQDGRRHEERVALLVETPGNFDVLHLAASRQVDAEGHVENDFLLLGRLEESIQTAFFIKAWL